MKNDPICSCCGKEFFSFGFKDCCSTRCRNKRLHQKKIATASAGKEGECKQCGDYFIFGSLSSYGICCSKKCNYLWNRREVRNVEAKCEYCGNRFIKKNKGHKYCSKKCCMLVGNKTYVENRKITHFEIFKHDNFTCQYCGKTPRDGIKLAVDHIYPLSKGGKEDRFNLITACEECNSSKSDKIMMQDLIINLWEYNENKYTYTQMKKYWKEDRRKRSR